MNITIKDVTKTYGNDSYKVDALAQINLEITDGEWITILGPSGSGKTTLLNCIAGLVKPDSGQIYNNRRNIFKISHVELQKYRRTSIGYIFQDFRLLDQYTVIDNVMLPQIPYQALNHIREQAKGILKELGMEKREKHFPSQLSGGEKQRTAIARALINQPSLLICDEPTGNLDQDSRNQIIEILKKLHEIGHTIILVTHDPAISNLGDRQYFMRDGRLNEIKS